MEQFSAEQSRATPRPHLRLFTARHPAMPPTGGATRHRRASALARGPRENRQRGVHSTNFNMTRRLSKLENNLDPFHRWIGGNTEVRSKCRFWGCNRRSQTDAAQTDPSIESPRRRVWTLAPTNGDGIPIAPKLQKSAIVQTTSRDRKKKKK